MDSRYTFNKKINKFYDRVAPVFGRSKWSSCYKVVASVATGSRKQWNCHRSSIRCGSKRNWRWNECYFLTKFNRCLKLLSWWRRSNDIWSCRRRSLNGYWKSNAERRLRNKCSSAWRSSNRVNRRFRRRS